MTTYVRAPEAARRLGVSTATLYAYVSRGRIGRITAADGRASLFDVDEVDALRDRGRRTSTAPPPTIDVRITSAVTQLSEEGLAYRGVPVESLVDVQFERVAELLWTGTLPDLAPTWPVVDGLECSDQDQPITVLDLIRLATELALHDRQTSARDGHSADDHPTAFAARLLATIPIAFGEAAPVVRTGTPYAERVTRLWDPAPALALVEAVNTTLVLLADHELATSTLAVRVAASVRSSLGAAIIAGLATVEGALHGSASSYAHDLFADAERRGITTVLDEYRSRKRPVPGFGHKIYRRRDPRFELLLDRVRRIPDPNGRLDVVETLITEAGSSVPRHPNIDLALGALTFVSGIPSGAPLFAIARIAGWTAHYLEELDERPVRFRGLARRVTDDAVAR